MTTLYGVVSTVYETDVNVSVRINYLNVWTTPADPYNQNALDTELQEFESFWNTNRSGVSRHVAVLLSGRSLGGGIANLTVLCQRGIAYNVCQLDGIYSYPNPSATWDAMVTAHELGHNFSSRHTHSCFWQANGYAAPGALLDSCFTPEGSCYSGPTGIRPPDKGTIMSYCHLVSGVANGIRMEFHSACKTEMRLHAEGCLPEGAYDSGSQLSATAAGSTVQLSWNPSPNSGVQRYDVYRSPTMQNLTPTLAGSTTTTSFSDPNRFGRNFYRLRAVRSGDQSAYTNEVEITACGPTGPDCYAVGALTNSPASGDFNHDGILDVALANNLASGTVTVIYGQGAGGVGDGMFAGATSFNAGSRAAGLAVGDFNEDGILDLAATNNLTTGTVSILLGNGAGGIGDGTFAAPVSYPVAQRPVGVLTADFDEDGIADLAVANNSSNSVSVLLGNGSGGVGVGTFGTAVNYPVGTRPTELVTGDFNEDGILDIAAVCNGNGRAAILLGNGTAGNGDGTFAPAVLYVAGANASAIVAGDFDDDGITDLAVTRNEDPGIVAVLRGLGAAGVGNGTFAAAVQHAAGAMPLGMALGDVNGDGITDFLVANASAVATTSVLLGTGSGGAGDGGFEEPIPFEAGPTPADVLMADFDEDGAPDLAIANSSSSENLCVLLSTCTPSSGTGVTVIAPNGGESWPASTEHTVQWSKGQAVSAVDIEVSRDGGTIWETIATNQTGTSFVWSVADPSTAPGQALIRISDPTVSSRSDVSNAGFQIAPDPRVGVPVGNGSDLRLALAVANPSRHGLSVRLTLPEAGAATLSVVDVSGRKVLSRPVGSLGAGRHVLDLPERLRTGVYLIELRQQGRSVSTKAAVVQ